MIGYGHQRCRVTLRMVAVYQRQRKQSLAAQRQFGSAETPSDDDSDRTVNGIIQHEREAKPTSNVSRLGLGGSKLSSPSQAEQYSSVIQTALRNGIRTFEAPASMDKGEDALVKAYNLAINRLEENEQHIERKATMTARFGYRGPPVETRSSDEHGSGGASASPSEFTGDVTVPTDLPGKATTGRGASHNISSEYVHHCLSESPLVRLRQQHMNHEESDIGVIYMVHNPEVQAGALIASSTGEDAGNDKNCKDSLPPVEDMRECVKERLYDSFVALEEASSNGTISSYGVCSNGLSLPSDHPLHLSWKDVILAASRAAAL